MDLEEFQIFVYILERLDDYYVPWVNKKAGDGSGGDD